MRMDCQAPSASVSHLMTENRNPGKRVPVTHWMQHHGDIAEASPLFLSLFFSFFMAGFEAAEPAIKC